MIVAEVGADAEESLRALLAMLNREPGVVDPDNALVPFRKFPQLHFARFVILKDLTTADLAERGESFPDVPPLLAFLGDCDGATEAFLHDLAAKAPDGLNTSSAIAGIQSIGAARALDDRSQCAAVQPTNWVERTVLQAHEEASR